MGTLIKKIVNAIRRMAIYIKDTVIKTIGLGSTSNPPIYIKDTKVFPTGVVTHALEAIGIYYSDGGTYLEPDQSNYGYVGGTYVTYVDGVEQSRTIVECKPLYAYTMGQILVEGYHFLWNKPTYGSQSMVSSTWAGVTGGTYDGTTLESSTLRVKYGANSKSYSGSQITSFTITPSNFSSDSRMLYTAIEGVRTGSWTSGNEVSDSFKGGSYGTNVTGYVSAAQQQGTSLDRIYTFTNNGSDAVTIISYLYAHAIWSEDGQQVEGSNWVSGSTTIEVGATANASLTCEVTSYGDDARIDSYRTYYMFDGDREEHELTTSPQTVSNTVEYGSEYYKITSTTSWLTISGMTISAAENTGSTRQATVSATDRAYLGTATASVTQQEKGKTYTMVLYDDANQTLIQDKGSVEASTDTFVIWDSGDNLREYTITFEDSALTYSVSGDTITIEGITSSTDSSVTISEASSGMEITFELRGA